jgi:hypothetical protein
VDDFVAAAGGGDGGLQAARAAAGDEDFAGRGRKDFGAVEFAADEGVDGAAPGGVAARSAMQVKQRRHLTCRRRGRP